MYFLLNKGKVIQEGDEFFNAFTQEWLYFPAQTGKIYEKGWIVRRKIRVMDIHQEFETGFAFSYDKGVSGLKLTKLKHGSADWEKEHERYCAAADGLNNAMNKLIELLTYE